MVPLLRRAKYESTVTRYEDVRIRSEVAKTRYKKGKIIARMMYRVFTSFCRVIATSCRIPTSPYRIIVFSPLGRQGEGTMTLTRHHTFQIEPNQFFGDDTALNAIRLLCSDKQGHRNITHQISSVQGPYGSWSKEEVCLQSYDVSSFLTAFQLQVEPPQGAGDDTMANFVHFKCRPFGDDPALNETILTLAPGHGSWGTWSNWTESCDANEAICGIQTKVEQVQGSDDDTALNDVVFYCCE
ncbi:Vitelline membrane outer layer protein 1 [Mactra antiquata]